MKLQQKLLKSFFFKYQWTFKTKFLNKWSILFILRNRGDIFFSFICGTTLHSLTNCGGEFYLSFAPYFVSLIDLYKHFISYLRSIWSITVSGGLQFHFGLKNILMLVLEVFLQRVCMLFGCFARVFWRSPASSVEADLAVCETISVPWMSLE